MNQQELDVILAEHKKWLVYEGGVRANLKGTNLESANLKGAFLQGAFLKNANLENAYLKNANLQDANLENANLAGANLQDASLENAYLKNANLKDANLEDTYLQSANLKDASLENADLKNANLQGTNLQGTYLQDANLEYANLEYANLEYATFSNNKIKGIKFSEDLLDEVPKIENIHKLVYENASKPYALNMDKWHKCETTHCRAGWVIHLAGKKGQSLEKKYGASAAAALIYIVSDPNLECIPDVFASENNALADMKRLAEQS